MAALQITLLAAVLVEAICILYLRLDVSTLRRRLDDYRDSLRNSQGEIIDNKYEAREAFNILGLQRTDAQSERWERSDDAVMDEVKRLRSQVADLYRKSAELRKKPENTNAD